MANDNFAPHTDHEGRMYREVRCQECRRLLGYEYVRDGRLRFECPKCKRINVLVFKPVKKAKIDDQESA